MKALRITFRILCTLAFAIFGAWFGASAGYANHGLSGSIVTGCVGLLMGAFVGSTPALFLQFWD
jgi:hypothetical protein